MTRFFRSFGTTASERALHRLCTETFLSLWSYANVYRDQGRPKQGADGKELCDLLVVFGRHVLIFSDKSCGFPDSGDSARDWSRWYKRAIARSAKQVFGAERWILHHPDRVYLDPACGIPMPIAIPANARVHRIVVATGARERHARGAGGSGSLMLNPAIVGSQHTEPTATPFTIGWVDGDKRYVHVFDELTIFTLLKQLDTVTDLVAYLERKEELLNAGGLAFAPNETCLLAMYLATLDSNERHTFPEGAVEGKSKLIIDPQAWNDLVALPNYRRKREADEPSYIWDSFIEYWTSHLMDGDLLGDVSQIELALREMASEPRVLRRALGQGILSVRSMVAQSGKNFGARTIATSPEKKKVYALLAVHDNGEDDYARYREYRQLVLQAYLHITKSRLPPAEKIIGLAFEPEGSAGGSEDLIYFEPPSPWTSEDDERARDFAENLGFDASPSMRHFRDWEFPRRLAQSPEEQRKTRNRRKRERKARKGRR